jgi:hypothetical protein
MQYYIDNEFDDYIETYQNQIKELWTNNYLPINQNAEIQNHGKKSALAAHLFKKHKISHDDELETFLNGPTINFDSDVLTFWKVTNQIYNICSRFIGYLLKFIKIYSCISLSIQILPIWQLIIWLFQVFFLQII